jgi:hypothetical protein
MSSAEERLGVVSADVTSDANNKLAAMAAIAADAL